MIVYAKQIKNFLHKQRKKTRYTYVNIKSSFSFSLRDLMNEQLSDKIDLFNFYRKQNISMGFQKFFSGDFNGQSVSSTAQVKVVIKKVSLFFRDQTHMSTIVINYLSRFTFKLLNIKAHAEQHLKN